MGRAYGNLMVDLIATAEKLRDRGERIVMEVTGADRETARAAIAAADGRVKLAIVMQRLGVPLEEAERRLEEAGGFVRKAVGAPPESPRPGPGPEAGRG
jgi:N-acetylmuramic acid 6-phosphate etherase